MTPRAKRSSSSTTGRHHAAPVEAAGQSWKLPRGAAERTGAGRLLAAARAALQLSSREMSALLGKDQRTVTRWEATHRMADIDGLIWIAYYFLLRQADADPALINALPVPSRGLCPRLRPSKNPAATDSAA
jgi:hypothetical protein